MNAVEMNKLLARAGSDCRVGCAEGAGLTILLTALIERIERLEKRNSTANTQGMSKAKEDTPND